MIDQLTALNKPDARVLIEGEQGYYGPTVASEVIFKPWELEGESESIESVIIQ